MAIYNNIPIFLSSDNNYAPFVATTIASVCDNTKSFCEFYVLDGGIADENKEKICKLEKQFHNLSVEFIRIDINNVFSNILAKGYITLSAFNRLLIPNLKRNLLKVVYLDVDIIAAGDINELYQQNLKSFIIGAVKDQGELNYLKNVKHAIELNPESVYFNSGVLLIDCDKWRKNIKLEDLLAIEQKYRNVRYHNDQDVLNKYFENNYLLLDKKYNVMETSEEVVLRHFTGSIKPWQADFYIHSKTKKPYKTSNIDLFWKYAKMTAFYDEILQQKEQFLSSNFLYSRFNKMVTGGNK